MKRESISAGLGEPNRLAHRAVIREKCGLFTRARRGKVVEARNLLTNIYDWFTEGFTSSIDLKEAKGLLEKIKMFNN